jgi:hypothetical protein
MPQAACSLQVEGHVCQHDPKTLALMFAAVALGRVMDLVHICAHLPITALGDAASSRAAPKKGLALAAGSTLPAAPVSVSEVTSECTYGRALARRAGSSTGRALSGQRST